MAITKTLSNIGAGKQQKKQAIAERCKTHEIEDTRRIKLKYLQEALKVFEALIQNACYLSKKCECRLLKQR